MHYLEAAARRDRLGCSSRQAVVKPLTGRKIGAYYGCMLLRPEHARCSLTTRRTRKCIEDFIRAIGAEPVIYAQRNECCGGYMAVEDRSYAAKQAQKIMDNAKAQGAELLITACPLCSYNLLHNTDGRAACRLFHGASGRGAWRAGRRTHEQPEHDRNRSLRISGVNPRKCMRCGKCSASCPAYDEMEYHPHQFVSMVENGRIEELLNSKGIYTCLSCFACVERCPRNVEPAKLIEAVRNAVHAPAGHGPPEARAHPGDS